MGFGGGALIASPLSQQLMSWYDPNYNPAVATSVPSGSAVAMLFVTLGIIYFVVMMYGVFNIRVPAGGLAAGRLGPGDAQGQAAGHDQQRVGRATRSGPRSSTSCGWSCSAT